MEDEREKVRKLEDELEETRLRVRELEEALARRQRTVDALREDDEKYRFHFLLANDVMFSYDDQFKVLSVSPNVERILGYKPEEFIGKTFYEAGVLDPEFMNQAVANALRVLSGETVFGSVYRFLPRDGSVRYGEISGVPIIHDGKVVKVVTVARDITARISMEDTLRASEERYRTTLEGLPDAVSILAVENCRYLYVNEAFSRITGWPAAEAVGKSPVELDLAENERDLEEFLALVREAVPVDGLECRCRSRRGDVLDTFVSARPVEYDGQGCMVVVMTDVTAVRRIEEEKKLMEIQSQKFESLGTLARGIAHDFNNILTTIIGYTRMSIKDILARTAGEDEFASVRGDLEEVRRSALRARDLVEQILLFSRHTEKPLVPLDLGEAVRDSLKILRPILPGTVELVQTTDVPGLIMGDPRQIHQVVTNLCTNAVHAMRDTRGRLEVGLARVNVDDTFRPDAGLPRGPCLKLTVSDTGTGMTEGTLSRIFDPYFSTRGKEHGTGLGLSVVNGIVRSHGGCIFCTSEPGQGTTFEIFFPEAAPRADDEAARTHVERMPRPRKPAPDGVGGVAGPVRDGVPASPEKEH